MKPKTVLILTHRDKETKEVLLPHIDWLKKTNPDVDIKVIVSEDAPEGKRYNWKNGDQPLRKWWLENRKTVSSEVIAVIEWDTFVSRELPSLPDSLDLAGKQVFFENPKIRNKWERKIMEDPGWHSDNWWWWPEIPRLDLLENEKATGLISFGAFFMRRWVLDSICKPRWDEVYKKDIVSELRFPSIAGVEGARVGEIHLPFVEWHETALGDEPGIYHGIKKQQ